MSLFRRVTDRLAAGALAVLERYRENHKPDPVLRDTSPATMPPRAKLEDRFGDLHGPMTLERVVEGHRVQFYLTQQKGGEPRWRVCVIEGGAVMLLTPPRFVSPEEGAEWLIAYLKESFWPGGAEWGPDPLWPKRVQ